jgi:hypothetical protein
MGSRNTFLQVGDWNFPIQRDKRQNIIQKNMQGRALVSIIC